MLAIITGTIKPDDSMGQLKMRDSEERLVQYIDSIRCFIESRAFSKIIFCENSNYGITELKELQKYAKQHKIELELLSFQGNMEQTIVHGKGYGEGEILNYVLNYSKLIKNETFFVKITGRLVIDNIYKISSLLDKNKTYFNIPNLFKNDFYDTRIYAMPINQYKSFFINSFKDVYDAEEIYLEHVYTRVLKDNKIKVTNFPRYPRIKGISGSTGISYTYTEWKCKIKDMISRIGGYRVRK